MCSDLFDRSLPLPDSPEHYDKAQARRWGLYGSHPATRGSERVLLMGAGEGLRGALDLGSGGQGHERPPGRQMRDRRRQHPQRQRLDRRRHLHRAGPVVRDLQAVAEHLQAGRLVLRGAGREEGAQTRRDCVVVLPKLLPYKHRNEVTLSLPSQRTTPTVPSSKPTTCIGA